MSVKTILNDILKLIEDNKIKTIFNHTTRTERLENPAFGNKVYQGKGYLIVGNNGDSGRTKKYIFKGSVDDIPIDLSLSSHGQVKIPFKSSVTVRHINTGNIDSTTDFSAYIEYTN